MTGFEPGEEFYFITADGEWPIYVATDEAQAINSAVHRQERGANGQVRITRVTLATVELLELQEEVVHRKLVPRGTGGAS